MWEPVLDALDPRGPVALATLPGHGPEPWIPEADGFEAVAEALAGAMPFEEPSWLVGYSMGARVGLAMALARPERFAGMVLVGVDPGLRTGEARAARVAWDEARAAEIEAQGVARFAESWERLPLFETQGELPEYVRARQREARKEHTVAGLAWAMRALGLGRMPSLWERMQGCERAVYVVTGELDRKFVALGEKITATVPRAKHRVVEGVGHNVALEAPGKLARWVAEAMGQ
jgi:2-succinyl-6-hydroxy-2,4-cyclohexadiene-1-carboxylate synthase